MINSFSPMAQGLLSSYWIIYPSSEISGHLFLSRSTGFPYLVKKGKVLFLCSWAFFISQAGFGPFCLATKSACWTNYTVTLKPSSKPQVSERSRLSRGSDLQPLFRDRRISLRQAIIHEAFLGLCLARGLTSPCAGNLPSMVPAVHHWVRHLWFIIKKYPALNHW